MAECYADGRVTRLQKHSNKSEYVMFYFPVAFVVYDNTITLHILLEIALFLNSNKALCTIEENVPQFSGLLWGTYS